MKKQISSKKYNDKLFIALGFISIGILFLVYSNIQDFSVTPDSIKATDRLAVVFYIIMSLSFGAISYGLYRYHHRKVLEGNDNILGNIASITLNKKAKKFLLSHSLHTGVFFLLHLEC